MSEGIQRILTALVGAPVVIGLTWLGGWWFGALVLAVGWLGMYELYHLVRREGPPPAARWGTLLGTVVLVHPLIPEARFVAGTILLAMLATAPFWRADEPLQRLEATLFGAVYPCLLLSMTLRLRVGSLLPQGELETLRFTLGLLAMVWATDISAYYVGRQWGTHRLVPEISPKKTWEGAMGGIAACLLVAGAGWRWILPGFGPAELAVAAVGVAVFAQLGDLLESRIKRSVEAKDSGRLLPGHGGILDRVDGLLLAAPYLYALLYLRSIVG